MVRTIDDTINHLLVSVGGGLIAGDIVAFLIGMGQELLLPIIYYILIGCVGFLLVLIGESRIYHSIYLCFKKKTNK